MVKKLYIRPLADVVDSDTLEEMFSSVGDVQTVNVEIKSVRGHDYRVGYVEMATVQEAMDSIDRFHGQKVHGQVLVVTADVPHIPTPTDQKKSNSNRELKSKTKSKVLA